MSTATAACTRPGCGGAIEDGYCNRCGLAPEPATATAACTRPGCGGAIEDGYCNRCGLAPEAPPTPQSAPGSAAAGAGSGAAPPAPNLAPPSVGAPSASVTGATASTRTGVATTHSTHLSQGHLGAGLVNIPPVPARDPATAVLANPQVAEAKRFCGKCGEPVGRGRGGSPGRTEGFCPHCGTAFSFSPRLARGEIVAGQYEVLGCLAHGGLGWIYLARDRHLSDRWVVLKGLLNTGDAAALEVAVAERRFLAQVHHPNIVGIYNFVQHPDSRTGEPAGYIVMEYVGGQSLRQILQAARATGASLAVPVALAYMIEVLPALGYLHEQGLVYCDFKPDNVIQTEDRLTLIDMGGVRRLDDEEGAIYGTVGYQAPEIATLGPSPSSDLYTVGRTLAVLTFPFSGYQSEYEHRLPDPATVPVLRDNDSFLRALQRATNADPAARFDSAGQMAEQLTGVLREVLSLADGLARPAFSGLFSGEIQAIGVPPMQQSGVSTSPPPAAEIVAALPLPAVDSEDPAAGFLATLSTLDETQWYLALSAAVAGRPGTPPAVAESVETRFAFIRALIVGHDLDHAAASLARDVPAGDWRTQWYSGLLELSRGNAPGARSAFDRVLAALPGEPAPKLALGLSAEAAGDLATAGRLFHTVWTVDHSFVSAAFGLARVMLATGDRGGAVRVLTAVPEVSSLYAPAQVAAIRVRLSPGPGGSNGQNPAAISADDLGAAAAALSGLDLDAMLRQQLSAEVLRAGLDRLLAGQAVPGNLLGHEPHERSLRTGLEQSYRAQARLVTDRAARVQLVDLANQVRPRTWS